MHLRLQVLSAGGAPYSILSIVEMVMRHMTRPEIASQLNLFFPEAAIQNLSSQEFEQAYTLARH